MIVRRVSVAACALVLAAPACGESDANPPTTSAQGTGGSAGSGGEPMGGGGGAPDNTCIACAQQSCDDEVTACTSVPGCQAWMACAQDCGGAADGAACLEACNDSFDGVAALYEAVYQCACRTCDDSCTGYDVCNQKCVDALALPLLETPPPLLSQTGYFADANTDPSRGPAPYLTVFEPKYVLWSDGAEKTRWWYVPKCAQIDTSDMDHWDLPVGTRFWKEFRRNGVLIETRFIHRFGPGADDWLFAAYHWDIVGSEVNDAVHVPAGVQNANGTPHDIPSEQQCINCHGKLVERALGFSAIQLSHQNSGMQSTSMASLSNAGKISVPNAGGYLVPGTPQEETALGYLHANCGNCHNATGVPEGMNVRVLVGHTTVQATDTYQTAVGVPVSGPFSTNTLCNGCLRINPGNAATSAVFIRMQQRGNAAQMPPIGSEIVDPAGLEIVGTWINSL